LRVKKKERVNEMLHGKIESNEQVTVRVELYGAAGRDRKLTENGRTHRDRGSEWAVWGRGKGAFIERKLRQSRNGVSVDGSMGRRKKIGRTSISDEREEESWQSSTKGTQCNSRR